MRKIYINQYTYTYINVYTYIKFLGSTKKIPLDILFSWALHIFTLWIAIAVDFIVILLKLYVPSERQVFYVLIIHVLICMCVYISAFKIFPRS